MRIIVLGYIVRGPLGGLVWHHLQYVLGLARLGHDVYFLEDSDDYESCYDPTTNTVTTNPRYGLRFIRKTFGEFDLSNRWAYFDAHENRWHNLSRSRVQQICTDADLLINLSGVNPLRAWFENVPVRLFVDTDPLFTQINLLKDSARRDEAAKHTSFFTFGENIARGNSGVPVEVARDNFDWQATRQPVVMDAWAEEKGNAAGGWTTVMQWDSYRACELAGVRYGMKSDSFAPYLTLPEKCNQRFELALGSATAPREQLASHGWRLRNPLEVTRDATSYQRYIRDSKAEFTIAKHGYVAARTGWFSERSAAYLASARPVVTQDTGFASWLPTGDGVCVFNSLAEAIENIEKINNRYNYHCRQAREIAATYFDSSVVLTRLINGAFGEVSLDKVSLGDDDDKVATQPCDLRV